MKSVYGESLDLLRQILEETQNGFRLREMTRQKIKEHIGKCEDIAEKSAKVYKEQWAIMNLEGKNGKERKGKTDR